MSKRRAGSSTEECMKSSKLEYIKPALFDSDLKAKLSQALKSGSSFDSGGGVELSTNPFPVFIIKDFFSNPSFVINLKNELSELDFFDKSNDLFKFQQSKDLIDSASKYTKMLRHFLFTTFRKWLEDVMDTPLDETVDMSSAKFESTDVLLCHDDELEGRRIAFIYYLVPEEWGESDGGALDLFSTDSRGHPNDIVRSITPTFNSFAFFEVTDRSYHQVAEVLSKDKTRMTVVGWFHGKSLERRSFAPVENPLPQPALPHEDELLLSWVNPMYLNPEIVADIGEQFEDNSEIQLKDFLQADKYSALVEEINGPDISWCKQGPPNKRVYWSLPHNSTTPTLLQEFVVLMKSVPFFKLLTKITGLEMALLGNDNDKEEEEDKDNGGSGCSSSSKENEPGIEFSIPPSCVVEVRQWKHGSYTLLQDQDYCGGEFVLDALFHIAADDWDESYNGGYVSYVAKDEGSELMRVEPISNCLSLVYRDEETSRFVKYFNHQLSNSCNRYFDISAVYFEGTR